HCRRSKEKRTDFNHHRALSWMSHFISAPQGSSEHPADQSTCMGSKFKTAVTTSAAMVGYTPMRKADQRS
ncbi:MAG: hypothetical protein ABL898_16225, partial [Hyphomicrobiaceae bacterium]